MAIHDFVAKFDQKRFRYAESKLSFFTFVDKLLEDYIADIQSDAISFDGLRASPFLERDFKKAALQIAKELRDLTTHALHVGLPDGVAYTKLKRLLQRNGQSIFNLILKSATRFVAPGALSFYRLRTVSSLTPTLPVTGLFHLPFNLRTKVSTQRFSLPGIPCLYLANSVYTAWHELDCPKQLAVVRVENIVPISFLDFDSRPFSSRPILADTDEQDEQLVLHALFLPFLFLTAQPVPDRSNTFKPEYVPPQLLAEIVRNCFPPIFAGIAYRSTRLLYDEYSVGDFVNYAVFPKNVQLEQGYCPELSQIFQVSEPIHIDLYNSKLAPLIAPESNKDIHHVNLVGTRVPFADSVFNRIEQILSTKKMNSFLSLAS